MDGQAQASHELPAAERSTVELVRNLFEEITRLVRTEIRLARRELGAKGKSAAKAGAALGIAAVLGLFGAATLVAAAVLLLALVLNAWASALTVGGALLIMAAVAAFEGRRRLGQSTPLFPADTFQEGKRDAMTAWEAMSE